MSWQLEIMKREEIKRMEDEVKNKTGGLNRIGTTKYIMVFKNNFKCNFFHMIYFIVSPLSKFLSLNKYKNK